MSSPGTRHRTVRIEDEDWKDFRAAVAAAGTDGSAEIRKFVRWYLRRPGADLPERPEAQEEHGE